MAQSRLHAGYKDLDINGRTAGHTRNRGFTLVELVVTLAVFAVLVSLAVPSFVRMMAADRMSGQTNELVMSLNTAKSEAIKRGQPATLRSRDDTNLINFIWVGRCLPMPMPMEPRHHGDEATALFERQPSSCRSTDHPLDTRRCGRPIHLSRGPTSLNGAELVTFNSRGGLNSPSSAFFRICDAAHQPFRGASSR